MSAHKSMLRSGTVLPMVLGASIAVAAGLAAASATAKQGNGLENPAAVTKAAGTIRLAGCTANPCAAKKGCNPCAAKGCNPCAAKACNPCAAKGCNPCAAKACNPCATKKKK